MTDRLKNNFDLLLLAAAWTITAILILITL